MGKFEYLVIPAQAGIHVPPVRAELVEAFNIHPPHTRLIAAFTLTFMRRLNSRLQLQAKRQITGVKTH
jgi:hypothetical protein